MMIKPFFTRLMCAGSLLVACGSDTTREDTSEVHASAYASDASAAAPSAAMDGGTLDATSSESDVCATLTYANTGKPFFATYCAGCHQLPQPTFNELDEVRNFKSRIQARLFQSPSAPMPPPYVLKQPSAEEKTKLQQWLRCDPLD